MNVKNPRKLAFLLVTMMVLSILAGCNGTGFQTTSEVGSKGTSDGKPITVWNCDNSPLFEDAVKQLIANYKEANPDMEVDYTGLPWSNAKEKFDVAIATDTAPDCAYVVQSWVGSMANAGGLLPFNNYVDQWDIKDEFDWDLIYNSGLAPTGDLYMMPFEYGSVICWYRTDWYKDAGIKAPDTFDEFFDNIKATNDPASRRYGFSMIGNANVMTQLECFLISYSGTTSYFDDKGECFVTDPKVLEGLKRYAGLYNVYTAEGDISNSHIEMLAAFGSGLAGTIYHNSSSYPDHLKNLEDPSLFDCFVLPTADNGVRSIPTGSFSYAGWIMFEDTKHPDDTWDFISFCCNSEQQSYWNQTVAGLPTNLVTQVEPWVEEYPALARLRDALAAEETAFCAVPVEYPDFMSVHTNILVPGFQAVLLGEKQPEVFLEEWNVAIKKAKADYEASNK